MPRNSDNSEPRDSRRAPYVLIFLTIGLVAVLAAILTAYLRTVDRIADTIEEVAGDFRPEIITETFAQHQFRVASTRGRTLEVATADAVESFTRSSALSLWNQRIPLGTTVSEITVPVTYRYHIDLNEPWTVMVDGETCIVHAPRFQPSLPVAIDTSGMQKKTRSGWARFDGRESLDALEQTLTPKLAERAENPGTRDQVREECRESVQNFVRNWLLRESHWKPGRITGIEVVFPDDSPKSDTADDAAPGPSIRVQETSKS